MIHPRNIAAFAGLVLLLGAAPLLNPAADEAGPGPVLAERPGAVPGIRAVSFTLAEEGQPPTLPQRLARATRHMTQGTSEGRPRERAL